MIAYQRSTVIITELLLAWVLHRCVRSAPPGAFVTQAQIHSRVGGSVSTANHLDFSLPASGVPHRRPYTLPVQWLYVRNLPLVASHGPKRMFRYTLALYSLRSTQGNKLASGILFAVLLNFKHIYMYLAVSLPVLSSPHRRPLFFSAGLLYLPASLILHDAKWPHPAQELSFLGQFSDCCVRGVPRSVRAHGADSPTALAPIPLYPRT